MTNITLLPVNMGLEPAFGASSTKLSKYLCIVLCKSLELPLIALDFVSKEMDLWS